MSIGDVLTLIGDLGALAAALFAFLALRKASDSIREAKAQTAAMQAAALEATEADRQASADRLAATKFAMSQQLWEQEQRTARRVERVGEIVEELFWKAVQAQNVPQLLEGKPAAVEGVLWMEPRNRLGQALVGLRDRLPKCVALVEQAKMPAQAIGLAAAARTEVEYELKYLHGELARPG